ncbi:MAG TPA: acyl-CoA dehydrogenase family protein [Candidatus Binatia bacterium]|jgi:alkylation response protein AidB-like acyl-CoA dehydrogenase|nr:acyl-CoA dehydrogenase family protein [Candidatus Binatia bacterium]
MHIDLLPEHKALRDQIREYFRGIVTPAYEAEIAVTEGGGPEYMKALKKMGADGWLGVGWPKEYGGQGRTPIEQFIFFDEAWRANIVLPTLTIMSVSPMLMQYGTEEQKQRFLPKALHGDVHFAIGYTEAGAGTDLASLRTRAVRDGDQWVINGAKLYTSQAQYADFIWLAARTDPTAKKHDGISIFMVPTSSPGYKISPLPTMGDVTTNATFFEDVRVPADHLIGPENGGWWLIVGQLNHERVSLIPYGPTDRYYQETRDWAAATKLPNGQRVIDQHWVQRNLAHVHAKLEVLKLLNWRQAWSMSRGEMNYAESSTVKVFGSEFYVEAYRLLLEILGQAGAVKAGSPEARLQGRLERMYRAILIMTFGAGTNEIQRDIIAMGGLGMPKSR